MRGIIRRYSCRAPRSLRRSGLLLGIVAAAVLSTGCVTVTDQPEKTFNAEEAARSRLKVGLHYLQKGDRVNARYNLERALEHSPDLPEVHNGLAWFFREVEDHERAEQAYRAALKLQGDDPATHNNYGSFLCERERFEEADAQFAKAIAHPGYIRTADALENAGLCALRGGEPLKAEEYLRKAFKYAPDRGTILLALAETQLALNEPMTAKGYLARYKKRHPVTAYSMSLNGQLALAQNDIEKAEQLAVELLTEYPAAEETQALLTRLRMVKK